MLAATLLLIFIHTFVRAPRRIRDRRCPKRCFPCRAQLFCVSCADFGTTSSPASRSGSSSSPTRFSRASTNIVEAQTAFRGLEAVGRKTRFAPFSVGRICSCRPTQPPSPPPPTQSATLRESIGSTAVAALNLRF